MQTQLEIYRSHERAVGALSSQLGGGEGVQVGTSGACTESIHFLLKHLRQWASPVSSPVMTLALHLPKLMKLCFCPGVMHGSTARTCVWGVCAMEVGFVEFLH